MGKYNIVMVDKFERVGIRIFWCFVVRLFIVFLIVVEEFLNGFCFDLKGIEDGNFEVVVRCWLCLVYNVF